MKPIKSALVLGLCLILQGLAQASAPYAPPLAADALTSPAKTLSKLRYEQEEADRVRYSVMIGSRDFHGLDQAAGEIIDRYSSQAINADEFILQMYLLVPTKSGKGHVDDLIEWTRSSPESYAAWYTLGRQYMDIALRARGSQWARDTSQEQFEQMYHYAKLAEETLLTSLTLHPQPMPSYRALIELDKYVYKTPNPRYLVDGSFLCSRVLAYSYYAYSFFCVTKNENYIEQPKQDYEYLQAALQADADSFLVYKLYFDSNTPRWRGSFEHLQEVLEQAKLSGLSEKNLAALTAELYEHQADEVVRLNVNNAAAASLYQRAFETDSRPENLYLLDSAAYYAKQGLDYELAITLYSQMISGFPNQHKALFERGVVYLEQKNDVAQYLRDQTESALLGNQYAQNNIGYFYLTGRYGFPVNLEQAKAWLELSADQGYDHARDKLAIVEAKQKQASAKAP